jgi:hypothetical protein
MSTTDHLNRAYRSEHAFRKPATVVTEGRPQPLLRASGIIRPGAQIEPGPCGPRQVILLTESRIHLAED